MSDEKICVSIIGGSGYTGGELLRLLAFHPQVEVSQITSERMVGKSITKMHPNLRKQVDLKFSSAKELDYCDTLFLCLPHGEGFENIDFYFERAKKIIDLSSNYRLHSAKLYEKYYGYMHPRPELLSRFIYGSPELHRTQLKTASYVAAPGCNATASILALYPFFKHQLVDLDRTVIEVKASSSEAGSTVTPASHHPERSGAVRSYMPTHHRHTAEIIQELSIHSSVNIHFSATSIEMVRGILATCHIFLTRELEEKDIWKLYRVEYGTEPFIRIVKESDGIFQLPEPKILTGTNYCDIGFEKDPDSNRTVIIAAIDNLMKGAAGQAVQVFNIMEGLDEATSLEFPGLHPI